MWPDMKKILLYSLGATFLTMVVGVLFVMGVFNFSTGAANLIGAEFGLHSSGEIEIHNQIVSNIHYIGNKMKWVNNAINVEGDITDEALITSLAITGENIQAKLKDLNSLFEGSSFTKDKQILKDTFLNDYKPAAEELSYLLMDLKKKEEIKTNPEVSAGNTSKENVVSEAKETTKKNTLGPVKPIILDPITADKKTQITNSCSKLIEAHNKFSDVLNDKRRY